MERQILSLCPRPTFWEGMARLFDFGDSLNHYNYSKSGDEADYRAILADWEMVGKDIETAIDLFADKYIN